MCKYAHIHTDTHMQQEQSCAHKQHHCRISINCTYPLQNRIRLKAGCAEESPGSMVFPLMYLASFFKKSLKPHKTKSSASNHKFLTAKLPENSLYPQPIEPSVFCCSSIFIKLAGTRLARINQAPHLLHINKNYKSFSCLRPLIQNCYHLLSSNYVLNVFTQYPIHPTRVLQSRWYFSSLSLQSKEKLLFYCRYRNLNLVCTTPMHSFLVVCLST